MPTIMQNDPHSTLILCHIALDAKHYISRTLLFEYEGKTYPLGERLTYLKRMRHKHADDILESLKSVEVRNHMLNYVAR